MNSNWTRRKLLGTAGTGLGLATLGSSDGFSRLLAQKTRAATVGEGDWPQFGYDATNSGYNPGTRGPERDAEVDWTYEPSVDGTIESPVVAEGAVYISPGDQVVALSEADGSEQWVYEEVSSPTPPAVANGTVFIGHEGGVVALNGEDGTEQWRSEGQGTVSQPPTIREETLYVNEDGPQFFALDTTTGEERWRTGQKEGATRSNRQVTPAVSDHSLWIQSDGRIFALIPQRAPEEFEGTGWIDTSRPIDSTDGTFEVINEKIVVEFTAAYGHYHGPPVITSDTVFLAGPSVQAVDIEDGSERWLFEEQILVPSSPAIGDEKLFFGSGDTLGGLESPEDAGENAGTVYALDTADGSVEWTFDADGPINTSPAATVRTVYVTSEEGTVYALSVFSGDATWSYEVGDGVGDPVVANNRLFVGTEENGLVALVEPENTETPTQTPTESQSDDNGGDETDSSDDSDDNNGDDDSDGNPAGNESDGSGDDGGGSDGFAPGLGIGSALAGLGGASYLLKRRFENDDQS